MAAHLISCPSCNRPGMKSIGSSDERLVKNAERDFDERGKPRGTLPRFSWFVCEAPIVVPSVNEGSKKQIVNCGVSVGLEL